MSRDRKINPFEAKAIARRRYAERQIDKYVKWSWNMKGRISYSKIVKLQKEHKIECYAWRR
jgi:hypothetical protein